MENLFIELYRLNDYVYVQEIGKKSQTKIHILDYDTWKRNIKEFK